MDTDKRKYLEIKRKELQGKLDNIEKQSILDTFILDLNKHGVKDLNIFDFDLPKSQIIKDTWRYDPVVPVFKTFNYRLGNSPTDVKGFISEWIETNSTQTILINIDQIVKKEDWLEINSNELLLNLDLLFENLDIEHDILVDKDSNCFLSISEFEDEVNIYKGKISDKQIEYYS